MYLQIDVVTLAGRLGIEVAACINEAAMDEAERRGYTVRPELPVDTPLDDDNWEGGDYLSTTLPMGVDVEESVGEVLPPVLRPYLAFLKKLDQHIAG